MKNKQKTNNLVSVIMPMFNASSTITLSINSVLNQDYRDIELIICDDNSNDDSFEIASSICDDRIVILKNQYEKGAAGARNTCIDHASGRFLAFLDSDDVWLEKKISTQLEYMTKNNCYFSYGDYFTFRDHPNKILGEFTAASSITYNCILKHCEVGCLTVMLDRFFLKNIKIQNCPKEDYATWVKILKEHKIVAKKYPGIHAGYRISSNSLSSNKIKEVFKQYYVLKNIAGLNRRRALYHMSKYIVRGIIKNTLLYRCNKSR